MTAKDLINYTIPPLKLTDKVDKARRWFSEFHTHELPVVDQGKFCGLFSEDMLFDQASEHLIRGFELDDSSIVREFEHYYDVLKVSYAENSNLIAVLDNSENYQGVISIQDVVEAFSKMSSITSPGAILVISINHIDYSMAELARIIESEYGKILSSFVEDHPEDTTKMRVTLKLNVENPKSIISALERFGFNITTTFGKNEDDEAEKERLDSLMRYLKV